MKTQIALSTLSIDLNGRVPSEIQLTPDGLFRAKDGRPQNLNGWFVDADIASRVIALAENQKNPFCIDYDHKVLTAQNTSAKGVAAGWFKTLEYREGVGIFAVDVAWTKEAARHIQESEYRFISPVFTFNKKTGAIEQILMCAITNNPALDGMKDLTALAQDLFLTSQTDSEMDKVKELEEQVAQLSKQLEEKDTQIAALSVQKTEPESKTETVDLTKFVPVETMAALQNELATLSKQVKDKEIDEVITAALSVGKLLPAQKEWAQKLGATDLVALKGFIETAPQLDIAKGTQTGGKPPEIVALNVKTPQGWDVDTEQVALHQQILAYQKEHNVDFTTAAVAVGV